MVGRVRSVLGICFLFFCFWARVKKFETLNAQEPSPEDLYTNAVRRFRSFALPTPVQMVPQSREAEGAGRARKKR